MNALLALSVFVQHRIADLGRRLRQLRPRPHRRPRSAWEVGQATAEYALVLLGVAAIALLLAAWAAKSGKVGQLFDAVVDQLIKKVK